MPSLALQSRSGACHRALQGAKACQILPDCLVAVSRVPGAPYLSLMCRVCQTTMQTQCRVGLLHELSIACLSVFCLQ